jgi:hypothetical protein
MGSNSMVFEGVVGSDGIPQAAEEGASVAVLVLLGRDGALAPSMFSVAFELNRKPHAHRASPLRN